LKPFDKQHAVRGAFGDPRYHLDADGHVSAFHFGVDIAAPDGTPVYSVTPGVVVRRLAASVTIGRPSGRRFGYWHIRPVVRSGTYVRLHQLLGYVGDGWGHVHFAESVHGAYRNPLRRGALAPFDDRTVPTVASVQVFAADGSVADTGRLVGAIDITADAYDTPPLPLPPPPWDVARLAPAVIWWTLTDGVGRVVESSTVVNFGVGLPVNAYYDSVYGPGTYENKPHRPGHYLYRVAHGFDTTRFADGRYTLEVTASDTRGNFGTAQVALVIANGVRRPSATG
jgi:hypothetical protein